MAKRGPKGPSKYTPAFIEAQAEAILIYADKCVKARRVPFEKEYAYTQRIPSEELSRFAQATDPNYNKKFAQSLKLFKDIQEACIVQGALEGSFNASFSIFALKNLAKWRDEQYLKGEGVANQIITIIRADGNKTEEVAGPVRVHECALPGDGIGLGNGKVVMRHSENTKALPGLSE